MDFLDDYDNSELLLIDVTFFPLTQKAWDYSRGARTVRKYNDLVAPALTSLRIKDEYEYTFTDGNRKIATVARHLKWLDTDGVTVILTKDISKEFTVKSLGELNQVIRNGRITDLVANAQQVTGGQSLIDSLYDWYEHDILEYIDRGTLAFENALKNETSPTRLGTLNFGIAEFGGVTIMQLLTFQLIGAYSWPV